MDGAKRYYQQNEAAEYVRMCVRQLFNYRKRGLLAAIPNGRRLVFDRADLDKLMEYLKRGGTDGQHND